MSFLSPALLGVLLPLLALPLALHLLNKGLPARLKFPSIDLIKQTVAQRSRLHRWRHWILLALRTIFLALLLTAFLLPVLKRFGTDPLAVGARNVLIMLDHSVSMESKGDGATSRERAVHETLRLIDSLETNDQVNVLLMDSNPSSCFAEFSREHAEARLFLDRVKPGLDRADVNLANGIAARLLAKAATRPEAYYISDFQRKNWSNVNFATLPPAVRLFFVDVGATKHDNRAILDARISQAQVLAGDKVLIEVTVGNYSSEAFAGRVTVLIDQSSSIDHETSIAPWSESKFAVPVPAGEPGVHLCEVSLPSDALEYDNRYCLALSVVQKEEVLIVADSTDSSTSAAYFLKMALNPFENEAGSLLPRVISSSELSPARLAGIHKAFFTHINPLNEAACAATVQFLFQGGGLIYFLDGPSDPGNLASLEKLIGPGTMPLRLSQRHTAANVATGAQQVVRGDFKSRYLKLFQGAARQNLALLEFYDYYQASPTGAGGVLMAYGDDSPAMGVLHHGRGSMLLLNFSASELSSNLARQRLFPAWMQELTKAVSSDEPARTAYTIGETLQTELWRSEMRDFDFMDPSGKTVTVKRELTGERYNVTLQPDQLGFYTLGEPRPLYAFGINTSPDEADLRPIAKDVLPNEFASERDAHFVAGAADFDELAKGKPLFHWFIMASAVFLLFETAFQFLVRRRVA